MICETVEELTPIIGNPAGVPRGRGVCGERLPPPPAPGTEAGSAAADA